MIDPNKPRQPNARLAMIHGIQLKTPSMKSSSGALVQALATSRPIGPNRAHVGHSEREDRLDHRNGKSNVEEQSHAGTVTERRPNAERETIALGLEVYFAT